MTRTTFNLWTLGSAAIVVACFLLGLCLPGCSSTSVTENRIDSDGATQLPTVDAGCPTSALVNWTCGDNNIPDPNFMATRPDDTKDWRCMDCTEPTNPTDNAFGGHQGYCFDHGSRQVCWHC